MSVYIADQRPQCKTGFNVIDFSLTTANCIKCSSFGEVDKTEKVAPVAKTTAFNGITGK